MLKKISLLIISILLFQPGIRAQDLQTDLSLKYLVRQAPTNTVKLPMLILLHGYGSNEADLFELRNAFPGNFIIVAPQAPMTIGNRAYQWYNISNPAGQPADLRKSTALLQRFIAEVIRKYHADPANVYLAGFSQGGAMSYQLGLTHPELVKGIGSLSGKIAPSLRPEIKATASLQRLRIFIGHGTADERIAYKEAEAANTYLRSLKLNPSFHTYPGMAHQISNDELKDFLQWLTGK